MISIYIIFFINNQKYMSIFFNNYMIRRYSKKEIYEISKLLEKSSLLSGYTNNYLGGEEIQKFETEFAKFHGCKYGLSVNSGTSALFVAQKAAGIKKGASNPLTDKAGKITKQQLREIAEKKLPDLNTNDVDQAAKIIAGTARQMGITVE